MTERLPTIQVRSDYGSLCARDGLVLCYFMNRSHVEVRQAIWRALQVYRRVIPTHSLNWYPDDEGDFQPLDPRGWKYIHNKLFEQNWTGPCSFDLVEHCDSAGAYNFEYHGYWLDDDLHAFYKKDPASAVSFTLPTEYLREHGSEHVRALAIELASELPLSFGYASFALVSPNGVWFMARRAVYELRERYPGIDIYRLHETSTTIGTQARGAYWLTFLGLPLLGRLGGAEHLRRLLPFPDITHSLLPPLEGERVLLTVGTGPEAIDTHLNEGPSPSLLALTRLLEPFLHEERSDWFRIFGDPDDMRRWTRRFCP